jgi:hypothetical protein
MHRKQAADVDAIEVGLDLGNATAGRQRLHKGHQRSSHAGIHQTDAHVHEERRCKAPCEQGGTTLKCLACHPVGTTRLASSSCTPPATASLVLKFNQNPQESAALKPSRILLKSRAAT